MMYQDEYEQPNQRALLRQLHAPGIAPGEPAPGLPTLPEAAPMAAPPASPKSPFQSDNRSLSGYLQEAAASYRPELIKLQGDTARKSGAESFIRSLEPELRARGWQGGDIRNEKIQVDGRWKDLFRDVDGVAEAQYLDVNDPAPAPGGGMGGGMGLAANGLNSLLTGDPMAGIQAAIGQYAGQGDNIKALLAQLMGGR